MCAERASCMRLVLWQVMQSWLVFSALSSPLREGSLGECTVWHWTQLRPRAAWTLSTSRTLGLSWPATIEQEEAAYQQSLSATQRIDFIVYECATLQPIGTTFLYEIDYRHSRAGFGIIIGENRERRAQWRRESPDFFWWER